MDCNCYFSMQIIYSAKKKCLEYSAVLYENPIQSAPGYEVLREYAYASYDKTPLTGIASALCHSPRML